MRKHFSMWFLFTPFRRQSYGFSATPAMICWESWICIWTSTDWSGRAAPDSIFPQKKDMENVSAKGNKSGLKKNGNCCIMGYSLKKEFVIPGMFDTPVYFEPTFWHTGFLYSWTDVRPPKSGRQMFKCGCPPSTARRQLFRKRHFGIAKDKKAARDRCFFSFNRKFADALHSFRFC